MISQQLAIVDMTYTLLFFCSGAFKLPQPFPSFAGLNGKGALIAPLALACTVSPYYIRTMQCGRRLRDEKARLRASFSFLFHSFFFLIPPPPPLTRHCEHVQIPDRCRRAGGALLLHVNLCRRRLRRR